MALTKLTKDMAIIQKLDDEPNDVGGLTAAQLKAKFDEAGEAIKEFLNETLLPELTAANAAGSLGAVLNGETMSVQNALDLLQLACVQAGNMPVGGGQGDILRKKSDETYDVEWAPPDAYTKAETLAPDTAALFGLDAPATPDDAFCAISDRVKKVVYGTYTGTGTFGADNPCSLTFETEPYCLFNLGSNYVLYVFPRQAKAYRNSHITMVEYSGKTITWYGDSAAAQNNAEGTNYAYVVFL